MKKPLRQSDGLYHVRGKTYKQLAGSRASVFHGGAYKTTGGLTKDDLVMNNSGHIVSKKKHITAKREKRLEKYGYYAKKGKFGAVRKNGKAITKKSKKKRKLTRKKIII